MRLRLFSLTAILALGCSGCTNDLLKDNTLNLAKTLTPFQYQQVLNNIAMFETHPNTLPSMLRISGGESQAADKITPGLKFAWGGAKQPTQEFDIGAERAWYSKFTVTPVTDPQDLVRLQLLFQYVTQHIDINQLKAGYANLPTATATIQITTSTSRPVNGGTETTTKTISSTEFAAALPIEHIAQNVKKIDDILTSVAAMNPNERVGTSIKKAKESVKTLKQTLVTTDSSASELNISGLTAAADQLATHLNSAVEKSSEVNVKSQLAQANIISKDMKTFIEKTGSASAPTTTGTSTQLPRQGDLINLEKNDWFHVWQFGNGEKLPPLDAFVGQYGSTIVWVDKRGEEKLSLFTLYLLGYATVNTAANEKLQLRSPGPLLTPN